MLGKRLQELRISKGLLQKDVAGKLKITTSAYGFYEQGKRMPDIETLKSLAKLFNVSVDYLLGRPSITAQRIKEIREKNNLSIKEFAEKFQIDETKLIEFETGLREFSYEIDATSDDIDSYLLRKLQTEYGVSMDYLKGWTNNFYEELPSEVLNEKIDESRKERGLTPIFNALTEKEEKDIEKRLEKMKKELSGSQGLMLSGNPVSPEALESILDALEFGMRQAKKINKKYTPKKYRNNQDSADPINDK